jgi:hypothetical protein
MIFMLIYEIFSPILSCTCTFSVDSFLIKAWNLFCDIDTWKSCVLTTEYVPEFYCGKVCATVSSTMASRTIDDKVGILTVI